ncbi:hypothetical protein ACR79M_14995 [Sphingobacterium spiritivorum]|uniref:hypothetical protein n=1 Tax=Sphingobacterium spiritivorum TaxID=258 RepID=UPI003DA53613
MNPLHITWAVLKATKGQATKRDLAILAKDTSASIFTCNNESLIMIYFTTQEKAKAAFVGLGKLNKEYIVTFITDKQFGMIDLTKDILNVATEKQKLESFKIS